MKRITQNDRDVLAYIAKYKTDHGGDSPTHRQIIANTNVKSTAHVADIIHKLEDAGFLQIGPHHELMLKFGFYTFSNDCLPDVGDPVTHHVYQVVKGKIIFDNDGT